MTQATSGRKRVYLEIPANWDQMTKERQEQVAEAMAEALQRQLGITDKSERGEQTADTREAVVDDAGTSE